MNFVRGLSAKFSRRSGRLLDCQMTTPMPTFALRVRPDRELYDRRRSTDGAFMPVPKYARASGELLRSPCHTKSMRASQNATCRSCVHASLHSAHCYAAPRASPAQANFGRWSWRSAAVSTLLPHTPPSLPPSSPSPPPHGSAAATAIAAAPPSPSPPSPRARPSQSVTRRSVAGVAAGVVAAAAAVTAAAAAPPPTPPLSPPPSPPPQPCVQSTICCRAALTAAALAAALSLPHRHRLRRRRHRCCRRHHRHLPWPSPLLSLPPP